MQTIYTIFFAIFFISTSILFYPIALLIWLFTVLFDKKLKFLHLFTQFWGIMYIKIVPSWSHKVINRHKADKNQTYIMISNHLSNMDILAISGLFLHYKWVSKFEVVKIPFVGWTMLLNRYILFRRADKESIKKMFHECELNLKAGNSIMMFPEGTRSPDGNMHTFKPGAFILAKKLELPILPIVLKETHLALPKNSLKFGTKCNMSVEVLDPVPFSEFGNLRIDEIAMKFENMIRAKYENL